MNICTIILTAMMAALLVGNAWAQEPTAPAKEATKEAGKEAGKETGPLNPVDTVKEFYRRLHDKQYLEGFHLSVYRTAVESLTPEELQDLAPDFENTFSHIPDNLKILGSQTNGANSTVFIKANNDPKDYTADEVTLIRINEEWLVGDLDTLAMVREQGHKFFFEIRIRVNEDNAQQYMERYIGAEKLYFDANKGNYGNIDDLVRASFWPQSLKSGEMYGYKFSVELNRDKKGFWVHAEPNSYGKSGRVSFSADLNGVYKVDNAGKIYRAQLKPDGGK